MMITPGMAAVREAAAQLAEREGVPTDVTGGMVGMLSAMLPDIAPDVIGWVCLAVCNGMLGVSFSAAADGNGEAASLLSQYAVVLGAVGNRAITESELPPIE